MTEIVQATYRRKKPEYSHRMVRIWEDEIDENTKTLLST
jgi:hypothetical protein